VARRRDRIHINPLGLLHPMQPPLAPVIEGPKTLVLLSLLLNLLYQSRVVVLIVQTNQN
jgi:hypothetical protein